MTVENNGVRTVLVDTPLPAAIKWTNDIVDKIRESIRPYAPSDDLTYASSGGLNWKLILGGVGVGIVAILLLRKRG
jgi:hypothetical protein